MTARKALPIVPIDAARLANVRASICLLSERQRKVLGLLANGFPAKAIAETLGISVRTVEFHIKNIRTRMEMPIGAVAVYVAVAERAAADQL